MYHDLKSRYW
jgi:hypothetical protein